MKKKNYNKLFTIIINKNLNNKIPDNKSNIYFYFMYKIA